MSFGWPSSEALATNCHQPRPPLLPHPNLNSPPTTRELDQKHGTNPDSLAQKWYHSAASPLQLDLQQVVLEPTGIPITGTLKLYYPTIHPSSSKDPVSMAFLSPAFVDFAQFAPPATCQSGAMHSNEYSRQNLEISKKWIRQLFRIHMLLGIQTTIYL